MSNSGNYFQEFIDDTLAVKAVTREDRLEAYCRAERILRAVLRSVPDIYGRNSQQEACTQMALGIALYNKGLHSIFLFGMRRRVLCIEAESCFGAAARIYGRRRETINVLLVHVIFNNWKASLYHNKEKRKAIFQRSDELLANIKSLAVRLDADEKEREKEKETAAARTVERNLAKVAERALDPVIAQAIAAGLKDLTVKEEEDRTEKEAAHARLRQDCAERADEIIAAIPEIIREKTAERCSNAAIMTLERMESDEPRGSTTMGEDDYGIRSYVSADSLRYAARLVYDHCKRVGLKPFVSRIIPEGQKECLLTLNISWDNPAASQRSEVNDRR